MLKPEVIWPDGPPAAARFEAVSGIPDVVGTVCTTRVPIVAPKANVTTYTYGSSGDDEVIWKSNGMVMKGKEIHRWECTSVVIFLNL